MWKPEHVLVGTDFSEGSEVALAIACEQAKTYGARLTILHAYSAALDLVDPQGTAPARIEIGTEVHRALAMVKAEYDGQVRQLHAEVLASESAGDTLCAYAKDTSVDLIVVGAHGRTRRSPFNVGSTAERVARHADCSVMIAR